MAKRVFDITLSCLGTFFLFPLWIIFAFVILFEDGLPIFYIQERVGKGGRIFKAIKFRTIYYGKNSSLMAKLLRRTALDESPQLINIIRGQMSFVGPRPLIPQEVNLCENQHLRCSVNPGLTGIAQLMAEKDAPVAEKLKYDLWYIEHQNIWLDIRLILKSFWMSLNRKWDIVRRAR